MEERLEHKLIRAVHEQRLTDTVTALDETESPILTEDDRRLLSDIQATCRAVAQSCVAEGNRLLGLMTAAGIDASFDAASAAASQRCFYLIELKVPSTHALSAVRVAEGEGYLSPFPMEGATWEVLHRFCHQTTGVKSDDLTMRLVIKWGEARTRGPLARLVTPTRQDAAMLSLPASLWPAAYVVRPFRNLRRMLAPGAGPQTQAPYVGTPADSISPLLDFASVGDEDLLVDLGCGDGRIIITAAERFGCQARGYENDPQIAAMARRRVRSSDARERVRICEEDLSGADLASATVVFVFMPANAMAPLIHRILQQVRPGTRLIAHEQEPLTETPPPDRSQLIVTPSIITVAHLWIRKPD